MSEQYTIQCSECQWETEIDADNLKDAKEQAETYACDHCDGEMKVI